MLCYIEKNWINKDKVKYLTNYFYKILVRTKNIKRQKLDLTY